MLEHVAEALEVDDTACLAAMHTLLADAHLLIEVGAAAALAGAWRHRPAIRASKTVLIFSGANSDRAMILRALETPKLGLGCKRIAHRDRIVSFGRGRKQRDRALNELFEIADVFDGGRRQLCPGPRPPRRCLPALERFIIRPPPVFALPRPPAAGRCAVRRAHRR